jgi:hypothetical protein
MFNSAFYAAFWKRRFAGVLYNFLKGLFAWVTVRLPFFSRLRVFWVAFFKRRKGELRPFFLAPELRPWNKKNDSD